MTRDFAGMLMVSKLILLLKKQIHKATISRQHCINCVIAGNIILGFRCGLDYSPYGSTWTRYVYSSSCFGKLNGTMCDDSNACTRTDTCMSEICVGTNPVICSALDQCHEVGTCNTTNGQCSQPFKADNSTCDDGDTCTDDDMCNSGVCIGTSFCPFATPTSEPIEAPVQIGLISSAGGLQIAQYLGIVVILVEILF